MTQEVALPDGIVRTPVPRSPRSDWRVPTYGAEIEAFRSTEVTTHLRKFFSALDAEAEQRKDDPIAMAHGLARMDALLADMRYVRDSMKDRCATVMDTLKIRRLTVEGVALVEASSTAARKNWQDERLLRNIVSTLLGDEFVNTETGEKLDAEIIAAELLRFFRPAWRTTPMKEYDINPDDYSDLPRDEDDKIIRTPTASVKDNLIRRNQ